MDKLRRQRKENKMGWEKTSQSRWPASRKEKRFDHIWVGQKLMHACVSKALHFANEATCRKRGELSALTQTIPTWCLETRSPIVSPCQCYLTWSIVLKEKKDSTFINDLSQDKLLWPPFFFCRHSIQLKLHNQNLFDNLLAPNADR